MKPLTEQEPEDDETETGAQQRSTGGEGEASHAVGEAAEGAYGRVSHAWRE